MAKLQTYTVKGAKTGTSDLSKKYDDKSDLRTLSQIIYIYQDRTHQGNSKVKTRGEVIASTAKIYRQKGTGRARHGDVKAPIFVGGGVAHGPKGVKRTLKLSKNLKVKALNKALDLKVAEGAIVAVEKIGSIAKTKEAAALIDKIKKDLKLGKMVKTLVLLADINGEVARSFRNIENVVLSPWSKLNAYQVYTSSLLIVDKDALDQKVKEKMPKGSEMKAEKVSGKITKVVKKEKKVVVKTVAEKAKKEKPLVRTSGSKNRGKAIGTKGRKK